MRFGRCVLLLEDLRYSLPSTLVLAGLLRRLDAGREAAREERFERRQLHRARGTPPALEERCPNGWTGAVSGSSCGNHH